MRVSIASDGGLKLRIGDSAGLGNLEYQKLKVVLTKGQPSCAAACFRLCRFYGMQQTVR